MDQATYCIAPDQATYSNCIAPNWYDGRRFWYDINWTGPCDFGPRFRSEIQWSGPAGFFGPDP